MARRSKYEESLSNSSSSEEEEQVNDQEEQPEEDDDEELEAVTRPVDSDEDDNPTATTDTSVEPVNDEDDEDDIDETKNEISHREKARLKEMQRLKEQKIQDILDQRNASIQADMVQLGATIFSKSVVLQRYFFPPVNFSCLLLDFSSVRVFFKDLQEQL